MLLFGLLAVSFYRSIIWFIGVCFFIGMMKHLLFDPKLIPYREIPDYIQIVSVHGPHPSNSARRGNVITATLRNIDPKRYTNNIMSDTDSPLWLGCMMTSGRLVAFRLTWIMGDEGPILPTIPPNTTMTVDFSTKLNVMEDPISTYDQIKDCKIGGSKEQAEIQFPE